MILSDSFELSQRFYYFGIVEDLILRFGWTLSMSLVEAGYVESEVMITILSPLEVFRRFMWNYFRLENEHLNNCGKFRAVRDISVAPMDCSDQVSSMVCLCPISQFFVTLLIDYSQTTVLRMMDDEDGVVNRRVRNKLPSKKKMDGRLLLRGESVDELDS